MKQVNLPNNLHRVGQRVHATTHKDNTGALNLATDEHLMLCTKYYNCRWHFFWQHIQNVDVEVVYCDTAEQNADYLTKPLVHDKIVTNRQRVQGC